MHGRAHGHLQGFQIQTARLAAGAERHAKQLVYFARDFLLDRFDCFFPGPLDRPVPGSAGIRRPRVALAKLAGEENLSVMVLPLTLRVSQ